MSDFTFHKASLRVILGEQNLGVLRPGHVRLASGHEGLSGGKIVFFSLLEPRRAS